MQGAVIARAIADSLIAHQRVLPICSTALARALCTTYPRGAADAHPPSNDQAPQDGSNTGPMANAGAAPQDNPLQPEIRMGLKLRMDKAVLTKLLQRHGVAVRGGLGAAIVLLEVLMEWKRMPAPPGDPTFKLEPHEEGHDMTPEQYMADIEILWEQRRAEWFARPEYQSLSPKENKP